MVLPQNRFDNHIRKLTQRHSQNVINCLYGTDRYFPVLGRGKIRKLTQTVKEFFSISTLILTLVTHFHLSQNSISRSQHCNSQIYLCTWPNVPCVQRNIVEFLLNKIASWEFATYMTFYCQYINYWREGTTLVILAKLLLWIWPVSSCNIMSLTRK